MDHREMRKPQGSQDRAAALHYVAILGPPAVGKSTLARALASRLGCEQFRLRQWTPLTALVDPKTGAPRGWLEEEAVHAAVSSFLDHVAGCGRNGQTRAFVTDNFPGTGRQVHLLHQLTSARFDVSHGTYLILDADARFLARRAQERRVCQTCEADPLADARLPAIRSWHSADTCRHCGGELTRRPNDAPALFARRLRRYRTHERRIRSAVLAVGGTLCELDSARSPRSNVVDICQNQREEANSI